MTLGAVVEIKPLTEAVRSALAVATARPAYFQKVGQNVPISKSLFPYNLLYVIPGGGLEGSFDFPDEEAEVVYQTTAVAEGPESALWLADRNRRFFLGRQADSAYVHQFPDIPGWKVIFRSPEAGLPEVMRGEGALYSVPERFVLKVVQG